MPTEQVAEPVTRQRSGGWTVVVQLKNRASPCMAKLAQNQAKTDALHPLTLEGCARSPFTTTNAGLSWLRPYLAERAA